MSQAVINIGKTLLLSNISIELMGTAATVFGATLGVAIGTVVVIGGVAYVVNNRTEKIIKELIRNFKH